MAERDWDDERLRAGFQALRAEDASRAPDVAPMLARARAEATGGVRVLRPRFGGHPRWAWAAGTLAAAALAGVLLLRSDGSGDFEALVAQYATAVGGSAWHSPTDGLLEVPGIELVRTVPTIGTRRRPPTPPPEGPPSGDHG